MSIVAKQERIHQFNQMCKEKGIASFVEASPDKPAGEGWYVRLRMPYNQVSWVSKIHRNLHDAIDEAMLRLSKALV